MQAFTLLMSMLLTGTAISLLNMQASNRRLHESLSSALQAQYLTEAGIEWVQWYFDNTPNWRETYTSGVSATIAPTPIMSTTMTLTDSDGDFTNDDTDPAMIEVVGKYDDAKMYMKGLMTPGTHEALDYLVYMSGIIDMQANVNVNGNLHASVSVDSLPRPANVVTKRIVTADHSKISSANYPDSLFSLPSGEPPPNPDLTFFTNQGTAVTPTDAGTELVLEYGVFTPTTNTHGIPDTKGIYVLDARGKNVWIKNVRVEGTLVITNTAGVDIWIEQGGRFIMGETGYPVLMVAGGADLLEINLQTDLVENSGTPTDYNEDGDTTDTLTSRIKGIVWTDATLMYVRSAGVTIKGCLIGKNFSAVGTPTLDYLKRVRAQVINEFTDNKLHLEPGSLELVN